MKKSGRYKIGKNDYLGVLSEAHRREILNNLGLESRKMTEIEKLGKTLEIGRGSVRHHLSILRRAGYITKKQKEDEQGKPVVLSITTKGEKALELFKKKIKEEFLKSKF